MKRYCLLIPTSLLLTALLPSLTQAQPVALSSTWGEYDLQEQQGHSAGLLSLAAQSSSGFTATVSSNGIAVGPDYTNYTGYPSKSQYLPRAYTTFAGQPITDLGSRVTVSFDVKFNDVADASNTGPFRVSLGDTNANNSLIGCCSIGASLGTINRYANTITKDTNALDLAGNFVFVPPDLTNPNNPTNLSMGSLCDGGLNMSTTLVGSQPPNSVGVGVDTTTTHHLRFSVERTPNGLQDDFVWSNTAGPNVFESAGAPLVGGNGDDHSGIANIVPWTNVNIVGFCLFGTGANEHFFGSNPGSFTISNLKAYYGFNVTSFQKVSGDDIISWESSAVDVCEYVVQTSTNLNTWTSISTNLTEGFTTSYTNTAPSDNALFYRVQKVYP